MSIKYPELDIPTGEELLQEMERSRRVAYSCNLITDTSDERIEMWDNRCLRVQEKLNDANQKTPRHE